MSRYAFTDLVSGILGIPVHERSKNFITQCPWHDDRMPSLSIDLDRGLYICFGCGERGNLKTLSDRYGKSIDNMDIIRRAYEATADSSYEPKKNFAKLAAELRENLLRDQPIQVVRYIVERNLHKGVVKHFGLGWRPYRECIAMPYYDEDAVDGIKYRPQVGPKFMEEGSRRTLYNLNDLSGRPLVIIGEGESDAHAIWSHTQHLGPEWGVGAIPGASMTRATFELWALSIAWANKVYIAFDADDAGDKAAETAQEVLGERYIRVRPTQGKDITDHLLAGGTLQEIGIP